MSKQSSCVKLRRLLSKTTSVFSGVALLCAIAAPASAYEREWSLSASEKEAYLIWGTPNTEDIGLSIWCEIGSKKLSVYTAEVASKNLKLKKQGQFSVRLDDESFKTQTVIKEKSRTGFIVEFSHDTTSKFAKKLIEASTISLDFGDYQRSVPLGDADFSGLMQMCEAN